MKMKASDQKETDTSNVAATGSTRSPAIRVDGDQRLIRKGASSECFYFQVARKVIGDKWSLLIMFILRDGGMRFNALLRGVEGISQKVLASSLRELERDGYINREVINASPPSVEYSLTLMGNDFLRMLTTVSAWVESNWQMIEDSRREYDLRTESIEQPSGDLLQTARSNQLQPMS
jgi:DNA-binding HxlR family transcriptional regulator